MPTGQTGILPNLPTGLKLKTCMTLVFFNQFFGPPQGPLATCQQKIQQRKQRPNIEHVSDAVEAQLHTEAANLIDTINKLEQCLSKNRSCYASLVKTRLELEAQIDVKANSIYIDEVKCMTLRKGMNMQAY